MRTVSCVIPAYNEADRIGAVLEVVVGHPLIQEVVVVDDASADQTGDVAREFQNASVITHEKGKGKSGALHSGIHETSGEFLFLLDADLVGLTPEDVTALIAPVIEGRADIAISLRGNTPWLWRMIGLDYISGERVFHKELLFEHLDRVRHLRGFAFEVFLNRIIVEKCLRLAIVPWKNVASPFPQEKYGLIRGARAFLGMLRDMFSIISPFEALAQIRAMLKLRQPTSLS